jgi:nitrite reductase (NADH) large subunit
MRKFVESYQCEWKNAIETPEILRRFRHFVNSDQPDPGVVFVTERGQIRPRPPADQALEVA